jgi:hypothetical protein
MLIHPLVVHLPIALWLTSTFFDLLAWWREDPFFRRTAYWLVGLGILGAAVSIAFGWLDLLAAEARGVWRDRLLPGRPRLAPADRQPLDCPPARPVDPGGHPHRQRSIPGGRAADRDVTVTQFVR